ncbi:unnamed protein product [Brassica oleracea]
MPTFRMNPNLELQELTQPPSHLSSLLIKVFTIRLKPKEKNVVTVVGKTFDQLVSNCPDNVHLDVSKTKRPLC